MFAGVDCFSGPLLPTARQPRIRSSEFTSRWIGLAAASCQRPNRTFRATRDDAAIVSEAPEDSSRTAKPPRRRIIFGFPREACHRRAGRCEDDPRARPLALDLRQYWIGTVARKINQHVEPLRHGERETGDAHRSNSVAVDGDDGAGERTEIDQNCVEDAPLINRSRTRPPDSVRMTSGSANVRSLARNAS
jgi:hypothetical protein